MDALSVLVSAGIAHAAFCRADWRRLLRADFERFEPDFEAVAGVVTDSYPGPDGAVRYDVRQHGKIWLGMHQDGSPDTEDSPWMRLSREDVRVWRLNAAGCALAERLAGSGAMVAAGDEARDEVFGNFSLIKVGRRKIDLAKKYKARAFLRFVHGYLKGEDKTFYVEELRSNSTSSLVISWRIDVGTRTGSGRTCSRASTKKISMRCLRLWTKPPAFIC
ncbi:MAG TPA: hypothetical protein PLU38_08965 [Kiritimatiellia bacterium]|nr:MAG: hypothetical protein BWX70_01322 [Verrucomicrobia bacterium ADurb.Bin070]HQQ91983.1 hypothetical protein [Kiritimatiellia bacterium]